MISTASLGKFQAMVAATLSETADVQRPTPVPDGQGGRTRTWVTVLTDAPCRFSRMVISPREVETEIAVRALTYWAFTFAAGTDVRSQDRILVDNRTFEVLSGGEGSPSVMTRVIALEIV